jgi:hypothetical protein
MSRSLLIILAQSHRLEFDLDQSYLPEIIKQCAAIVQKVPRSWDT